MMSMNRISIRPTFFCALGLRALLGAAFLLLAGMAAYAQTPPPAKEAATAPATGEKARERAPPPFSFAASAPS